MATVERIWLDIAKKKGEIIMKKEQKKRIRNVVLVVTILILGIAIFICNIFKITPGYDSRITCLITDVIAYGFFIGMGMVLIAMIKLDEITSKEYARKKTPKKIRK